MQVTFYPRRNSRIKYLSSYPFEEIIDNSGPDNGKDLLGSKNKSKCTDKCRDNHNRCIISG